MGTQSKLIEARSKVFRTISTILVLDTGGATREADNKGMTTRFAVLEVDFIKPIFLHIYVVSATLHALSTMYIVQLYIVHIAVQNNLIERRVI